MDLSKPMKIGAFVDFNRTRKYSEDDYILPETPPFSWLLRKTQEDANNNSDAAHAAPEEVTAATKGEAPCNKENENQNTAGSGKRTSAEEQQQQQKSIGGALVNSQRPSRWSVSPTLDEEKFLKELVGSRAVHKRRREKYCYYFSDKVKGCRRLSD